MKKPKCEVCGKENHSGYEWCKACMKAACDVPGCKVCGTPKEAEAALSSKGD